LKSRSRDLGNAPLRANFVFFELAPRGSQLSFKFQLDLTYCFGDIAIVRFWHLAGKCLFGPIFSGFGDFNPLKCDIVVLTPNVCMYVCMYV